MLRNKRAFLGIMLIVIMIVPLAIWYLSSTSSNGVAIEEALSKVPLPPNTDSFTINGDNLESSFYVRSEYTNRSVAEIEAFYRSWFKDNGWEDNFAAEEASEGLLDYSNDRRRMNVTLIDLNGTVHLMVTYFDLPYSDEQFEELVNASAAKDAEAIVESVRETYRNLATYADSATLERYEAGELSDKAEFRTLKSESSDLLFEYREVEPTFDPTTGVLSIQANEIRTGTNFEKEVEMLDDVSMAIASFTGITMGTAGTISTLLLDLEEPNLFNLANLTKIANEPAHDGTPCQRLQGTDFLGGVCIIWVGVEDSLIRQLEVKSDGDVREIIHYTPRLDIEITAEDLAFIPPEYE